MERNPLASLMMGLRGGGGTTEGARAYPGSTSTQWQPDEIALVQKHFGVDDQKWKTLDHSTQFNLLIEAADKEAALKAPPYEWSQYEAPTMPAYENPPARNLPEYLPGQPTVRAYHGTTSGPVGYSLIPAEADISKGLEEQTGKPYRQPESIQPKFLTPDPHRTEQGVFFTPDPETASKYAGYSEPGGFQKGTYEGSKVFPVDLDMKNSVTVDLRKIPGMTDYQRIYDPQYVKTAIEQAKQQNKDFVVIKGMNDVGGSADQIIALKPAGKVKNAITGETMYAHPLSALLAAALAGGAVSRRQRADETTIVPENIGRP